MFNHGWLRKALLLAGIAILLYPGDGVARQTVVNGSLGLGYDFWERKYDNENAMNLLYPDEGDRREWGVWPEIELRSRDIHDTVSLRYAPVLKYDDLLDTTNVDHYLNLAAERFLAKDWTVSLANDFVLSSDPNRYGQTFSSPGQIGPAEEAAGPVQPAQVEPAPAEITQNLGSRRYWTDNLVLGTTYTYAENSDVGLGYGLRVLRNDSDEQQITAGYDEYDRHEFSGLWSYKFNPTWRSDMKLSYIRGLYDDVETAVLPGLIEPAAIPAVSSVSQDLEEYWADAGFDYARSVNDIFPFQYRFREAQYENFRQDIWAHELSAGWDHAFDSRTRLRIGAGPAYIESEDLNGEWGYNAYLNFSRTYQHAELRAQASKRYETRNFTGSGDSGLTDLIEARVDLTYQFTPTLSATLFGLYRDEEILNPQGEYYLSALGGRDPLTIDNIGDVTYMRDSYSFGASASYGFWRWFVATARYAYYDQDADLMQDSYYEHRVTLLISASKELWR